IIMNSRVAAAAALAFVVSASAAHPQSVALTAEQQRAMGVRTVAATAAEAAPVARLSGVFTPPPNGRAAVSAPFAGMVTEVTVVEGQAVRAGQVLATVFSREALAAMGDLGAAQAEARAAAAAAERTRRLYDEGIVAGARADEAQARHDAARAVLAQRAVS